MKIFQSNIAANDAELYDTIPAEINYIGGSLTDGTHSNPVLTGGMVLWNIPGAVNDYTAHIEWWGVITTCGTIYNKASFKPNDASPPIDSNTTTINVACPGTDTFTPTFTPTPTATPTYTSTGTPTSTPTSTLTFTPTSTASPVQMPTIEINKAVSPSTAGAGQTVTYTINYQNTGLVPATNVRIWDSLAADLVYISGGTYTTPPPVVSWIIPSVPAASGWLNVSFLAAVTNTVTINEIIPNIALIQSNEIPLPLLSNNAPLDVQVPELILEKETNYPNPVVNNTTIVYRLTVAAEVNIKFFTISGELVRTMTGISGVAGRNYQYWDSNNESGNPLSSGIYIYKITASKDGEDDQFVFGKLAIMR